MYAYRDYQNTHRCYYTLCTCSMQNKLCREHDTVVYMQWKHQCHTTSIDLLMTVILLHATQSGPPPLLEHKIYTTPISNCI